MCPTLNVTAEHQTRELLNLLLLLERCLRLPDATAEETAEWATDLADVRQRLDEVVAPSDGTKRLVRRLATESQLVNALPSA